MKRTISKSSFTGPRCDLCKETKHKQARVSSYFALFRGFFRFTFAFVAWKPILPSVPQQQWANVWTRSNFRRRFILMNPWNSALYGGAWWMREEEASSAVRVCCAVCKVFCFLLFFINYLSSPWMVTGHQLSVVLLLAIGVLGCILPWVSGSTSRDLTGVGDVWSCFPKFLPSSRGRSFKMPSRDITHRITTDSFSATARAEASS